MITNGCAFYRETHNNKWVLVHVLSSRALLGDLSILIHIQVMIENIPRAVCGHLRLKRFRAAMIEEYPLSR